MQRATPRPWRTVAGYALDRIDPGDVNLNWLVCGSEGTLATLVRAELQLVARPKIEHKRLALAHFDTLRAALEATATHFGAWGRLPSN